MHLLLPHHRNIETALIATTVWGLVWFLGYYRVLRDHPHTVERDTATLRFGFRRSCRLPLASIATAKTSRAFSEGASPRALAGYKKWERFCVNHCDLIELTLSPEATVEEFTGESHQVRRLAVSFDNADAFLQAVGRRRAS